MFGPKPPRRIFRDDDIAQGALTIVPDGEVVDGALSLFDPEVHAYDKFDQIAEELHRLRQGRKPKKPPREERL